MPLTLPPPVTGAVITELSRLDDPVLWFALLDATIRKQGVKAEGVVICRRHLARHGYTLDLPSAPPNEAESTEVST